SQTRKRSLGPDPAVTGKESMSPFSSFNPITIGQQAKKPTRRTARSHESQEPRMDPTANPKNKINVNPKLELRDRVIEFQPNRPKRKFVGLVEAQQDFIGREKELKTICEHFLDAETGTLKDPATINTLNVYGVAGIGKSALVREFALRQGHKYD